MEELEVRKVYQVLPDREASREGRVRVIDESGEDYIYPADLFVAVKLRLLSCGDSERGLTRPPGKRGVPFAGQDKPKSPMESDLDNDRLLFSPLKTHRGWYLVEYAPPLHGTPFATLSLTTLERAALAKVAQAMETELTVWLNRYPVPIMVSTFSDSGELLRLSPVRTCDHLIGWLDPATNAPRVHWRLVPSAEFPRLDLSPGTLRKIYSDVQRDHGG